MSKVQVKVVIGSNYGDEGKGLATHYFSLNGKKVLNVLFNGGSQRGHTVEYKNGTRMVFHHFGSGVYDGAVTYFDQDFMVNPMTFVTEYYSFVLPTLHRAPVCYVSPNCRFTTPFDMLLNQSVEILRNKNKHGSCGCGIWETQKRYELSEYNLTYGEFAKLSGEEMSEYLNRVKEFSLKRLKDEYGFDEPPEEYKIFFENADNIIEHYIGDFSEMVFITKMADFNSIAKQYETIVFEGAQGLELDENNKKGLPHLTASSTGSLVPVQRVSNLDCDIEICYVTRSYFTRHGAGDFPTECKVKRINKNIFDRTNVDNKFQDSLRYGLFNKEQFTQRVFADIERAKSVNKNIETSLMVTHLNYTKQDICGDCKLTDLVKYFDTVYLSRSRYAEDVKTQGDRNG